MSSERYYRAAVLMAGSGRVRRWFAPGVGTVVLVIIIAGNPWVADKIINASEHTTSSLLGWLYYLLRFVEWRVSTGSAMPNWYYVAGSDLQVVAFVVVVAILARRLSYTPGMAGVARFTGAVGSVVLAAMVAALIGGLMVEPGLSSSARADTGGGGGFILGNISQGVFFGALVGVLCAAVIAQRSGAWRSGSAGFLRRVNRGTDVSMPTWSPGSGKTGDVTRYLCVAARTDERFGERVVDEVLAEEMRSVASSVGVDLKPVLRHTLVAWRQHQRRDLALAGVFTITLAIAPIWTLIFLVFLWLAAGVTRATLARHPAQRSMPHLTPLRAAGVAAAVLAAVVLAFLVRIAFGSVTGLAAWLLGPVWVGVFILIGLLVMYGLIAHDKQVTHSAVVGQLRGAVFSPESAPAPGGSLPWIPARLTAIEQAADGNVTAYSGYEPFVGFGLAIDGWSFALPLLPATDPQGMTGPRRDVIPFTTTELVACMRARLQAVVGAGDSTPEGQDHLDGLVLEDRVFVNGSAPAAEARFRPQGGQLPSSRLSPEEVDRIALHPHGAVRHYLCAHVPSWGGEIMASSFLHVSTAGDVLYLRCDRRVLSPVASPYHDVDRMTETMTPGQRLRMFAEAAAELPGKVTGAHRRALHRGLLGSRHDRWLLRDTACAEEDLAFDYGARVSVRQMAIDPNYQNFFQAVDTSKHFSIITRLALAAVRDFLDDHGVDTTEFRAQQMMVLNQGIIQSGGISMVGSQAVGSSAQAAQTVQMPAASG